MGVGVTTLSMLLLLLLLSLVSASPFDPCQGLNCTACANNTQCGYCSTSDSTGNCTSLSLLAGLEW